ncbi:MAG: asparagine synthase (glutamine-hydrolyzing) [Planctomycetota bacterium]
MCGIVGFIGHPGADVTASLTAMNGAIHHRGPDDSGLLSSAHAGIAMRRLAIVGLGDGEQPIQSEDRRLALVGNGEIYNAPELRRDLEAQGHVFHGHSDIETALHLYEEHGTEAFSRLNGMFALAILDRTTQRVLIVRDRLGIKPLYYATTASGTLIASEIPALRTAHPQDFTAIDTDALRNYMTLGYSAGAQTMHRGIEQLPAGHYGWCDANGVATSSWWELPHYTPEQRSTNDWCDELDALLRDSVRLRTMGDVQAGAFLSGGLDSGAILALLSQHQRPVPSFTIGFGDPDLDEIEAARLSARHHGSEHHVEIVPGVEMDELEDLFLHVGEPFADVSLLPTHRVSRLAGRHVKFVLSGDGGDELFAGYSWLQQEVRWRRLPAPLLHTARLLRPLLQNGQHSLRADLIGRCLRAAGDISSPPVQSFLRRRSMCPQRLLGALLHPRVRGQWRNLPDTPLETHARGWRGDPMELLLDLDRRFYLGGDILAKVDRATMRHSLEARVPFLDHRIVEFAARIPLQTHLGPSGQGKSILRRTIQPWLPPELLRMRKRGFGIPVDSWFQGSLLDAVEERLRDPRFREQELLSDRTVAAIIARQRNGQSRHGHLLWGLLSLAVWARSLTTPQLPSGTAHSSSALAL